MTRMTSRRSERRRSPPERGGGSAMGSSPAGYRGDRMYMWGEASCWRGVLLMTGGGTGASSRTGASRRGGNKAAVTVHGGTHDDPWRAATLSQTLSSRRETLSVSPCTQDPLCLSLHARPSLSPYEGENPYPEIVRTAPCEGETLFPEVANHTGPCVSPLIGENKRGLAAPGVCDFPIS